jgi:5'-nucleotidase
MGEDVTYSGTAGAAMEGALHGVKSIAFSQYIKDYNASFNYTHSAKFAAKLAKNILENGWALGEREFLNVNFPNCCNDGFNNGQEITYLGKRVYANDAHRHSNPRGEEYWWLGLHPLAWENREQEDKSLVSDFDAIKNNQISISPIQLDLTGYNRIEKLREWIL